ncbi:MAG: alpha/beta hydrolase-fold protein, partial [Opitutaceae bacterium]
MRLHPVPLALLAAALPLTLVAADDYPLGADSNPQDVPHGEVRTAVFTASKVFPGTTRDYFVYVPKQYRADQPACLMVFFDGAGMMNATGAYRVPVVFDNLIAKKEIPVTIVVAVNPGTVAASGAPGAKARSQRSYEYDSLGDANARFLLDELLPEALKGLNVTADPAGRAVCGNSSGGIAAFTIAWERPESFRKVISHIGSFTNIQGGYAYPGIIRKTKPAKPLRVFLQDGSGDLDNLHGNWPLSSQGMAAALKFAGYDYKFVFGTEGHNGKQGGA